MSPRSNNAASSTPRPVDIRVDLHAEDETGYVWVFLRRAVDPSMIKPGETVIAGNSGARTLVEVVDIVDGPTDKIVHLRFVEGSVAEFEARRRRLHHAV
jgi:hypothetical protein